MSELSNEEQQRLESWKELQLALGLSPDDAPPMSPSHSAPASAPAPPPARSERPRPAPVEQEVHLFGEGLMLEEPAVGSQAEAESAQEVEVGEAPEEIPDEPLTGEEKRRRRRRRRRRRGQDGDGESEAAEVVQAGAEPAAGPPNLEDADEEDAADDGLADEEDEEEEAESISFADWTVPSWNELIGSLYRPER